jgi:hypothetical protein
MKRKVFNAEVVGVRHSKAGNHVQLKTSGLIVFSKDFSREIKDTKINFVQDEARPKDWYIEPTKDPLGIQVKYFDKMQRCGIQAASIVKAILESLDLKGNHEVTLSSDSSDGMWAILTKTAAPTGGGQKKKISS